MVQKSVNDDSPAGINIQKEESFVKKLDLRNSEKKRREKEDRHLMKYIPKTPCISPETEVIQIE